jgi:predicted nucleotidyltransferase
MAQKRVITIAKKYIEALHKEKYFIYNAFLFGSYARNTPRKDSDIDIAVVLRSKRDVYDLNLELMKIRRDIDLRIEPHAFLKKDFTVNNPLAHEILKYGIPLI